MNRYGINIGRLLARLTPRLVRGRKLMDLLTGAFTPIASVHSGFLEWAKGIIVEAKVTSQMAVLERYLNARLGSYLAGDGRITLEMGGHMKNYSGTLDTENGGYVYGAGTAGAKPFVIYHLNEAYLTLNNTLIVRIPVLSGISVEEMDIELNKIFDRYMVYNCIIKKEYE